MTRVLQIEPTKTEFLSLVRDGNLVPVSCDLPADLETPISAFLKLRNGGERPDRSPGSMERPDRPPGSTEAFLLESVEGGEKIGRYSFLGVGPFMSLRAHGLAVELRGEGLAGGAGVEVRQGDPLAITREILQRYRPAATAGLPRFYGGAVGYFGYDLVRQWERLPHRPPDDVGLPTCYLLFTDAVVIFDHVKHSIKVVANALVDGDAAAAYRRAAERVEDLIERLRRPLVIPEVAGRVDPVLQTEMPVGQFMEAVDQAKEYVRAGDIFQVVLSRRFSLEVPGVDALDVYRALRAVNPSPYMFFLEFDGVQIAGSSPELLVRLEGDLVDTRPLAGTRPRGRDEDEDARLAADLLADEKERAEHIMLVDLGRNDLGRVCRYGTVEVTELMSIERFSHVMHIVSDVRGRLLPGRDAFDVLRACFPAGTVTGAPKVRAMEIIDELEPVGRGLYAGAVGYLGFSGNMDTCITIRTIVMAGGRAYVQAGAGIVADSVPEREYVETVNKAKALMRALERAGRRYRGAGP